MATDTAVVPALSTGAIGGSAADDLFRQFCRYLGIAYLLSLVGLAGVVSSFTHVVPIWWTVASGSSIYGSAALMVAASFRRPDVVWMRRAATMLVIGYGMTVATWPLVWDGNEIDAGYAIWFTQFSGFVAATAGVIWPMRWSFPYLCFVVVSVQFVIEAVRTSTHDGAVLTEIAWNFCLAAMPYAIAVAAVRSGRILDATRSGSVLAAAEAAASVARAGERTRIDALTHDGVMSTLLCAARLPMDPALAQQATDTLAKLDVLESEAAGATEFDAAAALAEFRGTAGQIDDAVRVKSAVDADAEDRSYPGEVVRTMSAATAEALRNSVHHAGSRARRSVTVTAKSDALEVVVSDDGVGFDPGSVPATRLGLAVSVRGRMAHLDGGRADVASAPGVGTTVSLCWIRP